MVINMRKFDYTSDYSEIPFLIKSYIDTLDEQLSWLIKNDNDELYIDAYNKIQAFKSKYPDFSKVKDQIFNDLLKAENIEYAFIHHVYPSNASNIGLEFSNDLKEIFDLESLLLNISIEHWKNDLTDFDNIINGEDFMVVAHASYQLPGIVGNENYRSGNYNRQFLSCSVLSNNELNTFQNSKIAYVTIVDENNYICSSEVDCATGEVSNPDLNTVGIINNNDDIHYVSAGYTMINSKAVTMIATPKLIESQSIKREVKQTGEMFNNNTLTNEVVLDRTKTRINGALLISNGCDLLIDEYLQLKRNNVPFKCINKGLYKEKHNLPSFTQKEYINFMDKLSKIEDLINSNYITASDLSNYYNEVVVNMNYQDIILDTIKETFSFYVDNKHY